MRGRSLNQPWRAFRRARLSLADAALSHGAGEAESRGVAPIRKRARGARRGGVGGRARLSALPGGPSRGPGSRGQSPCAISFPLRLAPPHRAGPRPSDAILCRNSTRKLTRSMNWSACRLQKLSTFAPDRFKRRVGTASGANVRKRTFGEHRFKREILEDPRPLRLRPLIPGPPPPGAASG